MRAQDLEQHAANGSKAAKDELKRRADRRDAAGGKVGGKRTGVPFSPSPAVARKAAETPTPTKSEKDIEADAAQRVAANVAAEAKRRADAEETRQQLAKVAADAAAEVTRQETEREVARKRVAEIMKNERDAVIEAAKEASKGLSTGYASIPSARAAQHEVIHTPTGSTVGRTIAGTDYSHNREGIVSTATKYRAYYKGKSISSHDTRADASQAIAAQHQADLTAAENATTRATNLSKRVAAGTGWEANTFQHDSTPEGIDAAQKIKQSFKSGNHTVHIETSMTKDQTQNFLADIATTVKRGSLQNEPVVFHVPSGDKHFRTTRRGTVGGYVRQGQNTVFVNPKIATGENEAGTKMSSHLMPALKQPDVTAKQYVIGHELGHIIDHARHHTRLAPAGTLGHRFVGEANPRAVALKKENNEALSTYGKTSVVESYAEAFAQWIHGGPGSSSVADAYAKEFGWTPPPKTN